MDTYKKSFYTLVILFIVGAALVSCSSKKNQAVQSIEAYIQALANKDANKLSTLSCSDWEANALVELDSFASVGTKVENLSCTDTGNADKNTYITCTGQMVLDYGGEAQKIDLSNRTYIATQSGGEWLMCGYK